jgi:hypothetical protein
MWASPTSKIVFDHGGKAAMTWSQSDHHPDGARMTCGLRPHQKLFSTKQKNQNLNDADSIFITICH